MKNPRILVGDDEAHIRIDLMYIVEGVGHYSIETADADENITMLERFPAIAAVPSDINMPGTIGGWRLSHTIRDRWPDRPRHHVGPILCEESADASGRSFYPKPYTPRQIATTRLIERALVHEPG